MPRTGALRVKPRQLLAEHIAQAPAFTRDAGQTQLHASRRSFPMLQSQRNACTPA